MPITPRPNNLWQNCSWCYWTMRLELGRGMLRVWAVQEQAKSIRWMTFLEWWSCVHGWARVAKKPDTGNCNSATSLGVYLMVGRGAILEEGDGYLPGEDRETTVLAKTPQLVELSSPNTQQNRATENSEQKPKGSVKVGSLMSSLAGLSGPGLAFRVKTCISHDPTRKTETTLWIENREFDPRIWLYR